MLDPEEPNYEAVGQLGLEALPHLEALVAGDDPMLASKAAYAASLLEGAAGREVVLAAARSDDLTVQVAAASAARNLPAPAAREVLARLLNHDDPGIRKVARESEH
jgi:HEAT repeat protein